MNLINKLLFPSKKVGLTSSNDKPQFIVTLTSYGNRIKNISHLAIKSILNGDTLPDRIILWLAHNDKNKISKQLLKLQEQGLEIRFCEDLKSYKKLIPALCEYPKDILITIDDDLRYKKDWFAKLKQTFINDSHKICCHRAHLITFDNENKILPYKKWEHCKANYQSPAKFIFPTGCGGILYPPNSLHTNVLDEKLFMTLCPKADDIWFWAMAKLQATEHCVVPNGYNLDDKKNDLQKKGGEESLWLKNVEENWNDKQINTILEKYPMLYPTN